VTEQSDTLDALLLAGVCAKEKVKSGKSMLKSAQVVL